MDTDTVLHHVSRKYDKRVRAMLTSIREELAEDGWKVSEPCDMHCDDYRWTMLASRIDSNPSELDEDDIDITVQICDAREYDGELAVDGKTDGLNFSVDVCTVGGSIIGGVTPFNYSGDVWVSVHDWDAIEERFSLVEDCDPSGMVCLLEDYK